VYRIRRERSLDQNASRGAARPRKKAEINITANKPVNFVPAAGLSYAGAAAA